MTGHALLKLVQDADESFEHDDAIEGARDHVQRAVLPVLAAAYSTLAWTQRRALVVLLQDHIDQATRSMIRDFLLSSPREQESYQTARAIALCHLEGSFDGFLDYLAHPEVVERRAREL